jgi:hypothetical protein
MKKKIDKFKITPKKKEIEELYKKCQIPNPITIIEKNNMTPLMKNNMTSNGTPIIYKTLGHRQPIVHESDIDSEAYKRYLAFNQKFEQKLLEKQIKNNDSVTPKNDKNIMDKFTSLEKRISELENRPSINQNNYLQVVCVNGNDNYLDMLTEKIGFAKALDFVQNCALSGLSGDCRMIEKIFIETDSMRCLDKNRVRIEYYDENEQKVVDIRGIILTGKLASSLQKTYIKGVNFLINDNIDNHRCPLKFLGDFDIQTWNTHIYGLSDVKYQRKLFNHMNIPLAPKEAMQ